MMHYQEQKEYARKSTAKGSDLPVYEHGKNGPHHSGFSEMPHSKVSANGDQDKLNGVGNNKLMVDVEDTRISKRILHQSSETQRSRGGTFVDKSFWIERMKLLKPLHLPFGKNDIGAKSRWETTAWFPPLLKADEGKATRMLVDAFVIHLAQLTGETKIQIGWKIDGTATKENQLMTEAVLVPMVVTVSLDKPWLSVSNAINDELMLIEQNRALLVDLMTEQLTTRAAFHARVSTLETIWPWQIAASLISSDGQRRENRTPHGQTLTLEIDARGGFRWVYDVSRLNYGALQKMSDRLDELVKVFTAQLSHDIPLCRLDMLSPKTNNGALLDSENSDDAQDGFEDLQGELEANIAMTMRKLLGVERVNRFDSFFALGGDSQSAVSMIESMRSLGLSLTIRDLFEHPVLSEIAANIQQYEAIEIPANVITPHTEELTPDMLPLVDVTQTDINRIISKVPGGLNNIQDVYALAPLQETILYHYLVATQGDPYLLMCEMSFLNRDLLDRYLTAVQRVIDRYDILRTAFIWKELSTPVQVVWRHAPVSVTDVTSTQDRGSFKDGLTSRYNPRQYRMNISQAPLVRYVVAQENDGRWIALQFVHHMIGDLTTLRTMHSEVQAFLTDREDTLTSHTAFRDLVASARLNISQEAHTEFFTEMLGGIDHPTLSFGVAVVYRDGSHITELNRLLSTELNDRLRDHAKNFHVSPATLCHLAWARLVSCTSGHERVVFGTVLLGRMQSRGGADTAMGLFVNTLPVRIDVDETSVQDCVRQTHMRLAGLLEHEHASLVLAQRCSGVVSGTALFNTLLNYRHNMFAKESTEIIRGIEMIGFEERTNYPLILSVEDFGSNLGLTAQTADPIDPERLCNYMEQTLESLVSALDLSPEVSVRSLQVLPKSERTELIATANSGMTPFCDWACIHQVFEQQVADMSAATALVHGIQSITYAELNSHANKVAHKLNDLGVLPEQLVAIYVDRSPAVVIGILAILKAGGAYLPLDPAHSSRRTSDILNDAKPSTLLVNDAGLAALRDIDVSKLTVINIDATLTLDLPISNPLVPNLTSRNLAYVIYTSGSTGRPKGVMIEHRNVVKLIDSTEALFDFSRLDVWCLFHSVAFDFSVWELWGALARGSQLVIVPTDIARFPQKMYDFVCDNDITVLNQTPSAFRITIASYITNPRKDQLRFIVFGGEALDSHLLSTWYTTRDDDKKPQLVNMYGMTETTVHATFKLLSRNDTKYSLSPIGSRLPDVTLYLFDKQCQPVPVGVTGEMYIGGAGVARGYLNQPELTEERFIADPFSDSATERVYKTGDLARHLPDGNLVFVGRNDQQIKVRGFRVEPGEIEACLTSYPNIRAAKVIPAGQGQEERLIAYVVGNAEDDLVQKLRLYTSTRLPHYMIPSAFVRLDSLPLTPNGKLDTTNLPTPDENAVVRGGYETPRGEIEMKLAEIWSKLLGIENVSRYDSFFELGGHSLLAISMIECIRSHGLTLAVWDLFECPILSELSAIVGQHEAVEIPPNVVSPDLNELSPDMLPLIDLTQKDIDVIVSSVPGGLVNIQDIYALSPLQDGVLFHHLLDETSDPYLLMSQLEFSTRDLLDRYLAAFQLVVDRHDILRTTFIWEHLSAPAQVVLRKANITASEVALVPDGEKVCDQLVRRYDPCVYRIDIRQAPLLRFWFAQDYDGPWILHQLFHHLLVDHTTCDVMFTEIAAFINDQDETLTSPAPFRNLIANARFSISKEAHVHFFTEMLADIQEPTLSFSLSGIHDDGSRAKELSRTLSKGLNDRLRYQSKHLRVSLATLCHVAWAQVVSRTSGNEKVVFGTILFGRMQAGEGSDTAMGLFINTLPLRIDLAGILVRACVQQMHERLARLLKHEHASLAVAQRCSGVTSGTPLFNTLLNYRHNISAADLSKRVTGIKILRFVERTNYPLAISIEDYGHSLGLTAQTIEEVDPDRLCGYMQRALESMIDALELLPYASMRSLDVLPELERTLLLHTWNSSTMLNRDEACVHELFEKQAAKTPHATAIVWEKGTMTYEELNMRANHLALRLIELGVVREQIVAICIGRSPAMLVGILAIFKAGGAYLPLDTTYLSQRLVDILRDAKPNIVVVDDEGRTALSDIDLSLFTTVDANTPGRSSATNPIVRNLSWRNLAYVIYTSGSTGQPKGVMVEHRNIVRLFDATESWADFDHHDVWCLLHSIAFDVSVWEMWGAFRYGGRLVLVPHEITRSAEELYQFICEHNVTVLNQTPGAFKATIANHVHGPIKDRLRCIIFGGEKLDPIILRSWIQIRGDTRTRLVYQYGPTETTVYATFNVLRQQDCERESISIGSRLPDLKLYLLDENQQPVPIGVTGELYISGPGVARGYLNRPDWTKERFTLDPFNDACDICMYKTGDLAMYLPDGKLAFVGRNDHQIKIRGFRVESGDVEACLKSHPVVRDARVLPVGEELNQRLVAYFVATTESKNNLVQDLHSHVKGRLPYYMVPSAFVRIEAFPLTPNGKLAIDKLPEPDANAVVRNTFEEACGEIETHLAIAWSKLLNIERVGRFDSFFELGGHSLLTMQLVECMRSVGLTLDVRDSFDHPVLSDLAKTIRKHTVIEVPKNVITPDSTELTPSMLPLVELTQADIDRIISKVSGGLANIQDIYALSPLQDGILFQYLLAEEGDPYLSVEQIAFSERGRLDSFLAAVQNVIDRHDILRTAFFWEELTVPVQVVLRRVTVSAIELECVPEEGSACDQLARHYDLRHYRIDIRQAPVLRFWFSQESDGRWILHQMLHHLIGDQTAFKVMHTEVAAFLNERAENLPNPTPFRNLVAYVHLGNRRENDVRFFTEMLSDICEPTLSFGLADVYNDSSLVTKSNHMLSRDLTDRLHAFAKRLNVSLAALHHLALARVVASTSGNERIIFGTVLFGRLQAGGGFGTAMGLFINTLPFRIDIDGTPVPDCVRKTHKSLARVLEHEHASLASAQRCSSIPNGTPLFNTLFNYRHSSLSIDSNEIIHGTEVIQIAGGTNYPINIIVDDYGFHLGLSAQVVEPVNPDRLCTYMQQTLESIVAALEFTPQLPVRSLMVLPESERTMLLDAWNTIEMLPPEEVCAHELFELQVAKTPEAIALVYRNEELTYAEVNTRANCLANELSRLGVVPEQIVAICIERSPAMVIGILAILKAGGAYLPLDPTYPSERLIHILNDATPHIMLADDVGRSVLTNIDFPALTVLNPNTLHIQPASNPKIPDLTSEHLAYVIYTSGTTGKPKGVMVEHRNIVRLFNASESWFDFGRHDAWCMIHSVAFDVSIWEIWGPLRYGGKLYLVPDEIVRSEEDMYQFVCANNITVLHQTPSLFKSSIGNFVKHPEQDHLKHLLVGGERVDTGCLRPWFDTRNDAQTRLVVFYGPTETTFYATYKILTRQDGEYASSPIGSRLPDVRIYLLDAFGSPVPLGATGELYIGGAGVARGYLNRPDLTEQRFLRDPFSDSADARMYKTGDLARYTSDDRNLIYVGRSDRQIKIRGFRVEAGEIEACLTEYSAVRAATLLACGEGPDTRLIAYVIADADDRLVQKLRLHVATRLPNYMVPSAFVRLDAFPITANGKLDVEKLPEPDKNAWARREYEAPQTKVERNLAEIWCNLLGVERVSRYDSFFEMGGHSLLVVRMIGQLRAVELTLAVRDLFKYPVLFELARNAVQYRETKVPPNVIDPDVTELTPSMLPLIDLTQADINALISTVPGGLANIQDIYALSPLQDGILFHYLLSTEDDPYLLMNQMAFSTHDLLERYLKAFQRVVDRHDILRTGFFWEELTVPVQVVLRKVSVCASKFTVMPGEGSASEQLLRRYNIYQYRMDIRRPPLLHFWVAQDTDGRWILHQLFHHLISDHKTFVVMFNEIGAFLNQRDDTLPKPVPFRNLIAHARFGISQEAHARFFIEMLGDVQEPTLLFGVSEIHNESALNKEARSVLPDDLNARLRDQAKQFGSSVAVLCHLAWAQIVARTSGCDKAIFGTVLFGRVQSVDNSDAAMGLFINALPLRINIDESALSDCLHRTHMRLAQLLEHEHASLVQAQRCSGMISGTPLFNSLLNYRHNISMLDLCNIISGVEFIRVAERTNYPIFFSIDDNGCTLGITALTTSSIDPNRLCAYMKQTLKSITDALELTPQKVVRSLEMLPQSERQMLIEEWNSITAFEFEDAFLHQKFEQQVSRTPEAIALVFQEENITYSELNRRANRLAHKLLRVGVVKEQLVAVCVARSPAMVIAIIAILKAGGAFVPLDPAYSSARLVDILNDTTPSIVLADDAGHIALRDANLSSFIAIDPNSESTLPEINPTVENLSSKNLAYVIYTSGSTGKPKGVMVEHRHIVRLFDATESAFHFDQHDTWCTVHSLGFDICVWEIWGALGYGGRLIIVPQNIMRSPHDLYRLICAQSVTVLNQTPSAFNALLPNLVEDPTSDRLRYIIFTGEPSNASVLKHWFQAVKRTKTQLVNMYGLTETTVHATIAILQEHHIEHLSVPSGTRIPDLRLYLLDKYGQPVPRGTVGEIHIGGAGVCRGYLNRPELTSERFLPDPFDNARQARMYKTGDLARFLPDENLIYMGRNDQQVKIRGYRVEPAEIESHLVEYPAIREAVVVVMDVERETRLIAYVVAEDEDNLVHNLYEYLTPRLPDYMVPSRFVRLEALPLTLNGKLDRKALPAPDEEAIVYEADEQPKSNVEATLAAVWCQLLGVERVGRRDNFFVLGGHSLLAVQMISLAVEYGLFCSLNDLFQYPVLADLAIKISPNTLAHHVAVPVRRGGTEPPIMFVPAGSGDFSYVFAIAPYLSTSFPIFALPWPRNEGPHSTLEVMALKMIALIKSVQPEGPYRICGYSSGGVLAHCIAHLLLAASDSPVSFLGLIDVQLPTRTLGRDTLKRIFLTSELNARSRPECSQDLALLIQKIDEYSIIDVVKFGQQLQVYPKNLSPDTYARQVEEHIDFAQSIREYVPQELNLTIHQLHCSEFPNNPALMHEDLISPDEDPSLGWSKIQRRPMIKTISIPGDHFTMMTSIENRILLADAINEACSTGQQNVQ